MRCSRVLRIDDSRCPIINLSSQIFYFSLVAQHSKFLMIWIAVRDIGDIALILHVNDEGIVGLFMDCFCLEEGYVFEGGSCCPCHF